jgi:hypothetical protein
VIVVGRLYTSGRRRRERTANFAMVKVKKALQMTCVVAIFGVGEESRLSIKVNLVFR